MSVLEKEIKTVSLRQFLEEHGQALGDRIEQELTPVYTNHKQLISIYVFPFT